MAAATTKTMSYSNNKDGNGHQYNPYDQQRQQQQQQQHQQYSNLFFGTGGSGGSGGAGSGSSSSYHDPLPFADFMNNVADDLAQSLYYPAPAAGAAPSATQGAGLQYAMMPSVNGQGNLYYAGNAGAPPPNSNGYSNSSGGSYQIQMPSRSSASGQPQQQYYATSASQHPQQTQYSSALSQPPALGNSPYYATAASANSSNGGSNYNSGLDQALLYNSELYQLASSTAGPTSATDYLLSQSDLDPTPVVNSSAKPSSSYGSTQIPPQPASSSSAVSDTKKNILSLNDLISSSIQPEDVSSIPLKLKEPGLGNPASIAFPRQLLSSSQSASQQQEEDSNAETATLPQSVAEETMRIPDLSVEPMTSAQVVEMIQSRADDVTKRYLPCVDFLVSCQQDLRRGVEKHKRSTGRHKMSTSQVSFDLLVEWCPVRHWMRYASNSILIDCIFLSNVPPHQSPIP
jgi:hypothetical protein